MKLRIFIFEKKRKKKKRESWREKLKSLCVLRTERVEKERDDGTLQYAVIATSQFSLHFSLSPSPPLSLTCSPADSVQFLSAL